MVGAFGLAIPAALAEDGLKPSAREQEYPPGWNVATAPSPQMYEIDVGTTALAYHATRAVPAPTPAENAQVIYEMLPGGHRYHRIAQ
jgi:hypothetical protein